MVTRLFVFCLLQALAANAGFYIVGGSLGAACGALLAGWLWFAVDFVRAGRVLRWVQGAAGGERPPGMGVMGEITDRVSRLLHMHMNLTADSEKRLSGILDALQATPNGVLLLDERDQISWCNRNAELHLSLDAERDAQQFIGNLLRDPDFSAYMAKADYAHDVVVTLRPAGESRPARISIQLCEYGVGQKLMLTRNVTALEQADAMRRDFVANVSHEIRTPLTVLAGFIETLQTLNLNDAERERYLALMGQQALRMQQVVEGLLVLSRLEASPPPGLGEWVPLASLLARCEQEARALSAVLGREQILSFPEATSSDLAANISGIPAELHSALSNLISNAVRYTPNHGSITVCWQWLPHGAATFAVHDSGPGIASEHMPRLTERFYRVDRSRSRAMGDAGGTGLGLAIVKHVAQRHGAQLQVDSVQGKGSTFALTFPAARLRREAHPLAPLPLALS